MTIAVLLQALGLVMDPYVLLVLIVTGKQIGRAHV